MSIFTTILRQFPPHTAHRIALGVLKTGFMPKAPIDHQVLKSRIWGLDFRNPVGLSAGFDKDAEAIGGLFSLGFGFVETGTVTPLPQRGNPRPNLFRLKEDKALINWLGFPSKGLVLFSRKLETALADAEGIVGANVGINTANPDAVGDIALCAEKLAPLADYLVINVSCPNTPGLMEWQTPDGISRILAETQSAVKRSGGNPPILVKLSPDIEGGKVEAVVKASVESGVAGFIISNTTLTRPPALLSDKKNEQGGLSGPPIANLASDLLKRIFKMTEGQVPLIASGGISSAEDAYERIRSGASLVQIYTALIYQGPGLVAEIAHGLVGLLKKDGFSSITEAVGVDHDFFKRG
jgi:dihydroorotate dehydrogenase